MQNIENMTNKTKSIEIDRSLCIESYTNIKSFGPALLRPPLFGPSLISALAELVFQKIVEDITFAYQKEPSIEQNLETGSFNLNHHFYFITVKLIYSSL